MSRTSKNLAFRSTTVLTVRRGERVAIGGDGQVSLGDTAVKHDARKIRALVDGKVLCGFAGSAADAFALLERFEAKLEQYKVNVRRAAIELAKEWRTDKILQKLEAVIAVTDKHHIFLVSGNGDVIEPDDGIVAIGSGGNYARVAARAFPAAGWDDPAKIVRQSLEIAADVCIYTNHQIEVLEG